MDKSIKSVALVDGDIIRYRCGFAAERTFYLIEITNPSNHKEYHSFRYKKEATEFAERACSGVEGASFTIWNRKELDTLDRCLQMVDSAIEDIRNATQCKEIRIYLSGKGNFREAVAKTKVYKANRENVPKPTYFREIGTHLREKYGALETQGHEADDAIGIGAMEAKETGVKFVVVSSDKDLLQIPGLHYDWTTKKTFEVSGREAKLNLYSQILSGDPTDNVPGIYGMGPAKAKDLLKAAKSPEELVDLVAQCYRDHVRQEDKKKGAVDRNSDDVAHRYMIEQANLVYILKRPNETWDLTKEGEYFNTKYLM